MGHAKGEYPAWVSEYEQDPLFWVSGFELSVPRRSVPETLAFVFGLHLRSKRGAMERMVPNGKPPKLL